MAICTSCTSQSIPYLPLKSATIHPAPLVEEDETAQGADGPAISSGSYGDELDLNDSTGTAEGSGGGAGKLDYIGSEAEGGNGGAGKLDVYV